MAGTAQRTTARKASGEHAHNSHNTAGARKSGLRQRDCVPYDENSFEHNETGEVPLYHLGIHFEDLASE